ncbi:RelA/SpoT domain-containing protein [Terrabacter sp. NPDC000476]|uniref:RelA/SpoT domain-containing protein n=1 Tax=Terrabacter sp. NPDC000476 TaxID=3154258 RepID=UPI00332E5A1B
MPPAPIIELPSKTKINKSGILLKQVFHDGVIPEGLLLEDLDEAWDTVNRFRAAHAYPMQKVRYGLRSMVRTQGASEVVSQRLKRVPRIVRKLHRMGNSNLARLEDIGGCRAVLKDGPELERVRRHVERQWRGQLAREPRDYIATPKDIGYRAVHLVVRRDERAIEVQLRTRGQQEWADAVEVADARLGLNLKDGVGPADMVEYFAVSGDVIYLREYGLPIDSTVLDRFEQARRAVIEAGYYTG